MNHENFPTITIPLPGLSNASLAELIEVLKREGFAIASLPGASMAAIARHYDRQLHRALIEQYSRNLAAERQRRQEANLLLLGASVRHNKPIEIPA